MCRCLLQDYPSCHDAPGEDCVHLQGFKVRAHRGQNQQGCSCKMRTRQQPRRVQKTPAKNRKGAQGEREVQTPDAITQEISLKWQPVLRRWFHLLCLISAHRRHIIIIIIIIIKPQGRRAFKQPNQPRRVRKRTRCHLQNLFDGGKKACCSELSKKAPLPCINRVDTTEQDFTHMDAPQRGFMAHYAQKTHNVATHKHPVLFSLNQS